MAAHRVEAYIIHLMRAQQRRPNVDDLGLRLPMRIYLVDAVYWDTLTDAAANAVYRRQIHKPKYPFELRRSEIACFLSHRKAWQQIVDSKLNAGLVVEDDVEPEALFTKALELALATMQPTDYVRFPYRSHTDDGPCVAESGSIALVQPVLVGLGMQMQLVGREAAAILLAATETFDRPVDTTIQMRWLTPARILAVKPPCTKEISDAVGGTLVQKKVKPLREVLARAVKRLVYRSKLRLALRKAELQAD